MQGKLEERNAGYWRIVTVLDQEIPPAWVTHAARKRAKRAKATAAAGAAATAAAAARKPADGAAESPSPPFPPLSREALPLPRGPFKDRVDRVFFFGDLNYRVDLSREDMELGVSVCRREGTGTEGRWRETRMGRRFRPGKGCFIIWRMICREELWRPLVYQPLVVIFLVFLLLSRGNGARVDDASLTCFTPTDIKPDVFWASFFCALQRY